MVSPHITEADRGVIHSAYAHQFLSGPLPHFFSNLLLLLFTAFLRVKKAKIKSRTTLVHRWLSTLEKLSLKEVLCTVLYTRLHQNLTRRPRPFPGHCPVSAACLLGTLASYASRPPPPTYTHLHTLPFPSRVYLHTLPCTYSTNHPSPPNASFLHRPPPSSLLGLCCPAHRWSCQAGGLVCVGVEHGQDSAGQGEARLGKPVCATSVGAAVKAIVSPPPLASQQVCSASGWGLLHHPPLGSSLFSPGRGHSTTLRSALLGSSQPGPWE